MSRLTLAVLFCVVAAMAASPVGSVTSPGFVELSGTRINARSLPSLPVVIGDEVATSDWPSIILFHDRSRVILGKNTRVKLEPQGTKTRLRVLEGSVSSNLAAGSELEILPVAGKVAKSVSQGSASLLNPAALPAGFSSTLRSSFGLWGPIKGGPAKSCPQPQPGQDPCKDGTEPDPACDENCGQGNTNP